MPDGRQRVHILDTEDNGHSIQTVDLETVVSLSYAVDDLGGITYTVLNGQAIGGIAAQSYRN